VAFFQPTANEFAWVESCREPESVLQPQYSIVIQVKTGHAEVVVTSLDVDNFEIAVEPLPLSQLPFTN